MANLVILVNMVVRAILKTCMKLKILGDFNNSGDFDGFYGYGKPGESDDYGKSGIFGESVNSLENGDSG